MASILSAGTTSATAMVHTADTSGVLQLASNNGTVGLTLDTSQNTTLAGSLSAPNTFGFKNRIINGAMVVSQYNGTNASTNAINGYFLDRFFVNQTTTGKLIAQQNAGSVTPPAGFQNYLGVTSQSAYSVGAGDFYVIGQAIEANNVQDLGWGTANAQAVTLSFRVYSSLTGTFGGVFKNYAATRSYPYTYTISAANTWTTVSVTIPGDTGGTWVNSGTSGNMYITFGLGVGSTYSGTAGSWSSANYQSATGATSVVGTNGATFYITGVQLEKGTVATPFDFRSIGTELALCQRYYQQIGKTNNVAYQPYSTGVCTGGGTTSQILPLSVVMRSVPTFTFNSPANTYTGSGTPVTAVTADIMSTNIIMYNTTVSGTPLLIGGGSRHYQQNAASSSLELSAEL